ncbi:VTC domain-containing protein [Halteromyces radiatus]|uniref:VTC domain-containing protein n=1 Tax=Halteromyces radiatus TaxID=101107 RepID=UPI00221F96CE|nr:VTC domain-containing protein [Halteromyces radiatus]KAI8089473.1 VTC domain-containing protein [Halteromyces radiatus]
MKYEQQLQARIHPPWRDYYMAYGSLKQFLKQKSDHWSSQDELTFEKLMAADLSKVCRFLQQQMEYIGKQIQQFEEQARQHIQQDRSANLPLTTQVMSLIFDLHDTNQFLYVNKLAFDKMVKKHDRYTTFLMRSRFSFMVDKSRLNSYMQQLDNNMTRLCHLYEECRQKQPLKLEEPNYDANRTILKGERQQQCTTFWIHPDNINEVKAICLFHLPMLPTSNTSSTSVNVQKTSKHPIDHAVSTVYFDNANFSLYKNTVSLCNDEDSISQTIERCDTMLQCQWYGQDSSKMYMSSYQKDDIDHQQRETIKHQCIVDNIPVNSFLSRWQHVLDEQHKFSHVESMQQMIHQQHLAPICHTTCQRSIFYEQYPDGTCLQIQVDNNITFNRPFDGCNKTNVRRMEQSDNHRFPYGILSLRHTGKQSIPLWLSQLVASHLVYAIPRFSVFAHAIKQLYCNLVLPSPYWMSIMENDIRKLPFNQVGLSRSESDRPLINGHRPTLLDTTPHVSIPLLTNPSTPIAQSFFRNVDGMMMYNKGNNSNNRITEPKTYFANERTFISWLQFCAMLLTVALSLFNRGDLISRWMGAIFLFITCLLACYALGRFQYRSWQLRTRRYVLRYDDKIGPSILCFFLVLAMMINLYLRSPIF